MAQYYTYSEGQFKYVRNPDTGMMCRTGQTGHKFVEQKNVGGVWITIGGYDDVADTGCKFREGVRDGNYVVDKELYVGGFADAEDVGWENIGGAEGWIPVRSLGGELPTTYHVGRSGLDMVDTIGALNAKIIPPVVKLNTTGANYLRTTIDLAGAVTFEMTANVKKAITDNFEWGQSAAGIAAFCQWYSDSKIYVAVGDGNQYGIAPLSTTTAHKVKIIYNGLGATNTDKLKLEVDDTPVAFTSFAGTIPASVPVQVGYMYLGFRSAASSGYMWDFSVTKDGVMQDSFPLTGQGLYEYGIYGNYVATWQGATLTHYAFIAGCGSSWLLDHGYSVFQKINVADEIVPYKNDSTPQTPTILSTYTKRTIGGDIAGNLTQHNNAPSVIDFDPLVSADARLDNFNRANTTIFSATARAGYYDASFPYRWFISEIDRFSMTSFYNTNYKWKVFPKMDTNSLSSRKKLIEIVNYATDKTGNDYTKILTYTGDKDFIWATRTYETNDLYLRYESAHADSSWENKVLKFVTDTLYLSVDGGLTYPYSIATPITQLQVSHIFANGNILFGSYKNIYYSEDNLTSIHEVTPKNPDGSDFVPSETGNNYMTAMIDGVRSVFNGIEMFTWVNYGNYVDGVNGTNQFYTIDGGKTIKIGYDFVAPHYQVNHGHGIFYNSDLDEYWMVTGDDTYGGHWFKGKYDWSTDIWTWTHVVAVLSNDDIHQTGSIAFRNGYAYWGTESGINTYWGIWKCAYADMGKGESYYTKIGAISQQCLGVIMNGANMLINYTGQLKCNISKDAGLTYKTCDLTAIDINKLGAPTSGYSEFYRANNVNNYGWYRNGILITNVAAGNMYTWGVIWMKFK